MNRKEQLKQAKKKYKQLVKLKGKQAVGLATALLFSDTKPPRWGSFIFYGKKIEECHIQLNKPKKLRK